MAPKYKQNDRVQEGTIDAVRTTNWGYDGTTTHSYLITDTSHFSLRGDPKWYDEKELHAFRPDSKFNVGDTVVYGTAPYIVQKKTYYENYGRWYYNLNHGMGVWELLLKKGRPTSKFKTGDVVLPWPKYWEDEMSKFTCADSKFKMDDEVYLVGDRLRRFRINAYSFNCKAKQWEYENFQGGKFLERNLTKYDPEAWNQIGPNEWQIKGARAEAIIGKIVGPPFLDGFDVGLLALIHKGHAYGSKPCEHFRETEFAVLAGKRQMVKNSFCPDCGKNIR